MSDFIHGRSIAQLRAERKELQKKYPAMGEAALRVHMISKYGISHDSSNRLVTASLEDVFRDDPNDGKSST